MRFATVEPETGETLPKMLKPRRDETLIAFLALMPIRCRALASLLIDDSICFLPDRIHITLSRDMTKTGLPWETTVPDCIAQLMRDYVEDVRPKLLAKASEDHDWFWVGDRGVPYTPNYFSGRIAKITEQTVGKAGVAPDVLLKAVKTHDAETEGYTRSKICFSDNWVKMRRWEKGLAQI